MTSCRYLLKLTYAAAGTSFFRRLVSSRATDAFIRSGIINGNTQLDSTPRSVIAPVVRRYTAMNQAVPMA